MLNLLSKIFFIWWVVMVLIFIKEMITNPKYRLYLIIWIVISGWVLVDYFTNLP
jgi:hypothetical protein